MAEKIDINQLTTEFSKSFRYASISDYDPEMIKNIVGGFYKMMEETGYPDITKWDGGLIFDVLMGVTEEAVKDGDERDVDTLLVFLEVIQSFIGFLSDTKKIPLSSQELDRVFSEYDDQMDSLLGPEEYHEYDDPNLPQWLEYVANDISEYTDDWVDAYVESSAWEKRQKGVDESILRMAMAALTDTAYNQYRKTPKSWTKKAIHGVLTSYFIKNVNFEADEYAYIVPALSGLLDYVVDQGWLNKKRAADYQRFLKASEAEMIELSKDSNNFGDAKLLAVKMLESGIDISDEKSVRDFITDINKQGGVSYLRKLDNDSKKTKNIGNVEELAKDFDPDPQRKFLNSPHLPELDGKKWDQATAIHVHELGVDYGTELALKRDKYVLPVEISVSVVVLSVSQMIDVLYAQHLQAPDEWTIATWQEFSSWLKENQTKEQYDRTVRLLESLMMFLKDRKVLSSKNAKEINSVIQGKVVSLDEARGRKNHDKK